MTGITRKTHKKSKLGCPQCKQRRAKCDERLPSCQNCAKREIRCGYLDYFPEQLKQIQISHWKASGSDPATDPTRSEPILPTSFLKNSSNLISSANNIFPTASSFNSKSQETRNSPINPYISQHDDKILNFKISLIDHYINRPDFPPIRYKHFCGETMSATFGRSLLLKRIHTKISLSFENLYLFNALLLHGCGTLLSSINVDLNGLFFRYKGKCLSFILKNISNINDSNADILILVMSLLNSSCVFQKHITFKEHFTLASGPASLLKEAYKDPSKFPKSFPNLKFQADGLFYTLNFLTVPGYDSTVLYEFYDVLKEFGLKYIENEEFKDQDELIVQQYKSILEFIEFCKDVLFNHKIDDENSRLNLSYPLPKIYEMVQRWYSICPSECFTLGSKTNSIDKIFYTFCFTLGVLLEAIIVRARYIFSYFLLGYLIIYPFDKDELLKGLDDNDLKWYLNYSCRIISFLHRRIPYITSNFKDPTKDDQNQSSPSPSFPVINENCITKFRSTVIRKANYPSTHSSPMIEKDSITSSNAENKYNSSKIAFNYESIAKSIKEKLDLSNSTDKVDMLNDINPKTYLLNCDYDPRYTDPVFNNSLILHDADSSFINRYIEDIRMILQMYPS